MWYRRNLSISPAKLSSGGRVILKFEAVDWQSEVYINGKQIGKHSGGYDGFEFDITEALGGKPTAELVVGVYDPTEKGDQPHGKQYMAAFSATKASSKYTSTSGIWATVWLEFVPASHIADLHVVSSVGDASATVLVNVSLVKYSTGKPDICAQRFPVKATVSLLDGRSIVGSASAAAGAWIADAGPSSGAVVGSREVATASVELTLSPVRKRSVQTIMANFQEKLKMVCHFLDAQTLESKLPLSAQCYCVA